MSENKSENKPDSKTEPLYTSRAHKGEYALQAPFRFVEAYGSDDAVPYKLREGTNLHCAFCGSLHPAQVVALLKAGASIHMADWKYGWPHKAYLESPHNKFYTRHLIDATPEDRAYIERRLGLHIDYNPDDQSVRWGPFVTPEGQT